MDSNPFTAAYPGTCSSCGFLSIIDSSVYRQPKQEFPGASRDSGVVSDSWRVWCFRHKANLQKEISEAVVADREEDHAQAVLQVIRKDRGPCVEDGSWYEWVDGFGPHWHYEDWRMTDLEKMRKKQNQSLQEIMESHKEITSKLATINSDQAEASDRQERSNRRFNLLFVGLAVAAILITMAQLAYPNGIDWLTDHAPGAANEITMTATPEPTP